MHDSHAVLTISKLAATADVNVETVRYYQRLGLLDQPARHGGFRYYGEAHVERLRFIRGSKEAGFTLEEVRELLNLDSVQDRERIRELASQRLRDIETRIAAMQGLASQLGRLIHECEERPAGACCPIIENLT